MQQTLPLDVPRKSHTKWAWAEVTRQNGGGYWAYVRHLSGIASGFDAATQAMIAKGELVEVRGTGPADPLNGMPFPMYRLAEASQ